MSSKMVSFRATEAQLDLFNKLVNRCKMKIHAKVSKPDIFLMGLELLNEISDQDLISLSNKVLTLK